MFKWFRKDLRSVLNKTKTVKVHGVIFTIRKINILNYLDGSKVLQQVFDTYKVGGPETIPPVSEKKLKEYFSQILVAGVVSPKISFKENDPDSIFVENLFTDWSLINDLYEQIMLYTYDGKKKVTSNTLQKTS